MPRITKVQKQIAEEKRTAHRMFYKMVMQTTQRDVDKDYAQTYLNIYPNSVLSRTELIEIAEYEIKTFNIRRN